MIVRLDESNIDGMLALQAQCLDNSDIFLPTSREGYLRAFRFDNFCYGYMEEGRLTAFLNCSLPTARGTGNLGRGRLREPELDRVGHMNTLLVDKFSRHHGIGRELVNASLCEFRKRNCPHIFVTASPQNTASLKLLDAMAFYVCDIIMLGGQRRFLLYRDLSE
jgi:ribosomal protein S18 acetylase RimI-like enzyme